MRRWSTSYPSSTSSNRDSCTLPCSLSQTRKALHDDTSAERKRRDAQLSINESSGSSCQANDAMEQFFGNCSCRLLMLSLQYDPADPPRH
jgi:hypothetical protein